MRKALAVNGVVVLAIITLTRPAYAYLDPGTGSIILQLLLGGLAGAAVVLKLYWARFKSFFSRKSDAESSSESQEGDKG